MEVVAQSRGVVLIGVAQQEGVRVTAPLAVACETVAQRRRTGQRRDGGTCRFLCPALVERRRWVWRELRL